MRLTSKVNTRKAENIKLITYYQAGMITASYRIGYKDRKTAAFTQLFAAVVEDNATTSSIQYFENHVT